MTNSTTYKNGARLYPGMVHRSKYLILLLLAVIVKASADTIPTNCPLVKIDIEQLPDLNIPRASHQVFMSNGEYVVAGGHTNGFIPTPTAEYLSDGEWHVTQMVYNHDFGFSVVLNSGKVLIGGGCSEPLGIGQTFLAELYDPETHSFNGFGSMERKRTGASGLELDSGCVVIAGNWYHKDGIELFDGKKRFTYIKDVAEERSCPLIFRTAKDNAVIFSGFGTKGDPLHSILADRLRGEAVSIPLFETWHPLGCSMHRSADSFIGNVSKGIYAYLFPVADSTGQVAIAKIENGDVRLLPTASQVPMKSQWGGIEYYSTIITDQKRGRAYLMGINADIHVQPEKGFRHYVLRIDYAEAVKGKPAPLTLYYTDPMQDMPDYAPVLTPEGHLLMAGGLTTAVSNFAPSGRAYVFLVGDSNAGLAEGSRIGWWLSALFAAALCAAIVLLILKHRKHKGTILSEKAEETTLAISDDDSTRLMRRINELIESKQLYLNSNLKVSDIADAFKLHRNDISACINSQTGCSFSQYINRYRIDYAKKLMREQSDLKVSSLWMECGFGSEQTFFKAFRTATGLSPKEWKAQIHLS